MAETSTTLNGVTTINGVTPPAAAIKERLRSGLCGEASVTVDESNTAIALVEAAAVQAVAEVLNDDQTTVGVYLDLQHLAATPVGLTVRAEAKLVQVEGRRLTFRVTAYDDVEQIGIGSHQRMLVETDRFLARTRAKQPK